MMDSGLSLNKTDRRILEEFHCACLDKKTADKIKAILLIDQGFTYEQIEKILLLDERTLNRYKRIYTEEGIDGLTANNYQGRSYKLTDDQIEILKDELNNHLYSTAEEVVEYVRETFKVNYSVKGMVQTLHRLGYAYKKARSIPGKFDEKKQKAFVKTYRRRYKSLSGNEKVYFMDGSHPTFNSHIGYGWIQKGKEFPVKTQDGRKRINLMGAYEPKEAEVVVRQYETLNAETTVDFLKGLRQKNGEKRLHIICDNVPYQHTPIVKETAKELNIHLKYLPAYSPNLNLIERYWGYLKRKLLMNTYYSSFEEFCEAIIRFTRKKSKRLKGELKKYIPEKFHLFDSVPT